MANVKLDQREHLKLLRELPPEVLVDFCKISLDHISIGPNEKKIASIAKKLKTDTENVKDAVESLISLVLDCIKYNVSDHTSAILQATGFSADHLNVIEQFIVSKGSAIEKYLKNTAIQEPRFLDLEWRLDARISSRCLLNQATPIIVLKLHLSSEALDENRTRLNSTTNDEHSNKILLLQTDPTNLTHLINQLERALSESQTHRVTNFVKAIR